MSENKHNLFSYLSPGFPRLLQALVGSEPYSNWSHSHKQDSRVVLQSLVASSLVAQTVKHLPTMRETWVQSLGREDPLEKEMATPSSTLAWEIPWMEEPGRLQSVGSQRVIYDWATSPYLTFSILSDWDLPFLPNTSWNVKVLVTQLCPTLCDPVDCSPPGSSLQNWPAMWETWVWSLGPEYPLEKGMATHSSILAWRIPWTEGPGELQSMGLQRVGQEGATNTFTFFTVWDTREAPGSPSC